MPSLETIFIDPNLVLLFNRIVLGIVMLYYGIPKIQDLKACADETVLMGFSPGWLWGTLVACAEVFGAVLLIAGVYPELFAAMIGFIMIIGTFWKLKTKKGFGDYSYDIHLLSMSAVVMAFGGGTFTLVSFSLFDLLRYDVVLGAFAAGLLFVLLCKPQAE